jgi:hypothetical protein
MERELTFEEKMALFNTAMDATRKSERALSFVGLCAVRYVGAEEDEFFLKILKTAVEDYKDAAEFEISAHAVMNDALAVTK